jgi:hypothetical protein
MPKPTTTEPLHDTMANAAANSVADLVRQNWTQLEAIMEERPKLSVSVSIKYSRSGSTYSQKVKLSFSDKFSDERDDTIDTKQTTMEGV